MPARDDRAVEIARTRHDLQPSPDDEQVEQEQDRGAEEAALLGERGEREVGRVRGQVVEPVCVAPSDAAAADARRRRPRSSTARRLYVASVRIVRRDA